MSEEERYYLATRENLLRDIANPSNERASVKEIEQLEISRVLDVGCGIGQAMFPLAVRHRAFGVGIDVSELPLQIGRELYRSQFPASRLAFMQCRAEDLPFADESFDIVNFGLALPYTENLKAIGEIARVLRPDGLFLLKIHHLRYYLRGLLKGLMRGAPLSAVHSSRVLGTGAIYHVLGRQVKTRVLNETFQTRWLLRRELARNGLVIEREAYSPDAAAPAFVIRKSMAVALAAAETEYTGRKQRRRDKPAAEVSF